MLAALPSGLASFTATQGQGQSDVGELRFVPAEILAQQARKQKLSTRIEVFAQSDRARTFVKGLARPDEWIVVAGSLYFVGETLFENRS